MPKVDVSGPLLGRDPLWFVSCKRPHPVCDHLVCIFMVAYGRFNCINIDTKFVDIILWFLFPIFLFRKYMKNPNAIILCIQGKKKICYFLVMMMVTKKKSEYCMRFIVHNKIICQNKIIMKNQVISPNKK